jgi:hypothetical protein
MRLDRTLSFSGSFGAGMSVYTGSRGNLSEVLCGITGIQRFDVVGGTTYYFMVWGFGGPDSGVVTLDLSEVLPLPDITLAIDPRGSVNSRTGVATVRGTVTCSRPFVLNYITVELSQLFARRVTISGGGSIGDVPCSTSGSAWSVVVQGVNGRFAPGGATATARTAACNQESCTDEVNVTKSIRLQGR